MNTSSIIFRLGWAAYVASFLLVAAVGPGNAATRSPIRGYACAWVAIVVPWSLAGMWSKGLLPVLMPALVITGLINPAFIGAVVALLRERRRSFVVLRAIVLAMLPFSWVSFLLVQPREGYFVWTSGMLLVLFSGLPARPTDVSMPGAA